jgi:hypothetical protein
MDKNIPWFNKKIPKKVSKSLQEKILKSRMQFEIKERYMMGYFSYE